VLHDDKPADIDSVAKDIIHRKARYLRRRGGFSRNDLPDLEQELSRHLLKRTPAFDPHKADWAVFAAAVVTAWGANLLRARYAAKRDYRRNQALPARTEASEGERREPVEMLRQHEHDARLGRHRPSEQEQLELKLDVQEALQRLPEDLRSIAERLQHISIAELAHELGMPRTTLYELIERIRRRFQKMGLGKNR
jgi:RNA polymerase sigma-70 factor (ECF subfamily)